LSTVHCNPHFSSAIYRFELKREISFFKVGKDGIHVSSYRCQKRDGQEFINEFDTLLQASLAKVKKLILDLFKSQQLLLNGKCGEIPVDASPSIAETVVKQKTQYLDRTKANFLKEKALCMSADERCDVLDKVSKALNKLLEEQAIFVSTMNQTQINDKIERIKAIAPLYIMEAFGIRTTGLVPSLRLQCLETIIASEKLIKVEEYLTCFSQKNYRNVQYPNEGDVALYFSNKGCSIGIMTKSGLIESKWGLSGNKAYVHELFHGPVEGSVLFLRDSSMVTFP